MRFIINLLSLFILLNHFEATLNIKPSAYNLDSQGPLNIVLHSAFGGRSHIKSVFEIGTKLAKRGHKVLYAALDDNLPFVDGYNISKVFLGSGLIDSDKMRKMMKKMHKQKELNELKAFSENVGPTLVAYYKKIFPSFKNYLQEAKPDLLVCDFFANACIDLAKELGIPLISSFQSTDFPALNIKPYITTSFTYGPVYTKELSFFGRLNYLIIKPLTSIKYMFEMIDNLNQAREQLGITRTNGLLGDIDYGLKIANTFTGFEPAVPFDPSLIQIGPIMSFNTQKFDKKLEEFFDKHENTLYIAFGSNAILNPDLSSKLLQAAIKAIDLKIIDSIIWGLGRTKQEDFPSQITTSSDRVYNVSLFFNSQHHHIRLLNWAPQANILNHHNTKLFISHGGIESIFEGLYSGTPILCLALFGDQFRNARKLEYINAGMFLDKKILTSDSLLNKIQTIIEDKNNKYISGITKMKTIAFYSSKRIELAADLFEQHAYTAKGCRKFHPFNPKSGLPPCEVEHLIPASNQMNFITSNGLDVYITFILILMIGILTIAFLLVKLISYLKSLTKTKAKKKTK